MKRKRYAETQIIGILKEAEQGVPVTDLCRKHGMSNATFYTWRRKYAGMNVAEAKRLRQLEDENRRLKKLVADQALDIDMLKAATQEERQNRVPSHLRGKISIHRVASGKRLGTAHIWSQGSGLDLAANNSPDTVREFVATLRSIIQ